MKATGIFSWPGEERRSNRYGFVGLWPNDYEHTASVLPDVDLFALRLLQGRRVRMAAKVLEARESGHIGDFFRGIYPSKPDVGEVVYLGEGTLVLGNCAGVPLVGLQPDDGREHDWIDPRALYRLHDQTVELEIMDLAAQA